MSRENVDVARRAYAAFNRRDLDAVLELFDPAVEVHDPPEMPDAAVHRGPDAVLRDWQQTFDSFDDFQIDVDECRDISDSQLLLFLRYRGRGRGSGAVVDAPITHLLTLREGKLLKMQQFLDRSAALAAADSAR